MSLPFRRPQKAAERALSAYWDDLAFAESSSEVLPIDVDPHLASTVRQIERLAEEAIPRADFADRMLDDLLGKHREEMAMRIASPEAQARMFSQSPARALQFPERRRGVGYVGAAAVALLLVGAVVFALIRQSDPDSPPPDLPAAVQEPNATPESSTAGTPEVMVNPESIETLWQWDLPPEENQNDGYDQYLRVAVSPNGEIYAFDPDADATIHLLDANGTETSIWGGPGQEPGTFNFGLVGSGNPTPGGDIGFDAEGNIYIFDSGNDRIQKFSPDRQFLKEWTIEGSENVEYNKPLGAVDPVNGRVYVVTEFYPGVQVFDLEGNLLAAWGEFGGKEGQFRAPSDVAVAPDGTVWISDRAISRIQHFDADGTFLGMLGGERGGDPGQFNQVTNLFIDGAYNIYVADFGNGRIQVIRPDGTPLLVFNMIGGSDRLVGAFALWVDDEGSLYVGDSFDDRVLKLRLPPMT
ncbi:MAG: NHL repeat-containing protein [Thermomicrobiales bacterium]